ncbi:aminotransferase class V-fold PLP-dependent enzyme [Splendidivirga corallicola]
MSPSSKRVDDVGQKALMLKRFPYQITAQDFFDNVSKLRSAFGNLINTIDSDRIAVIPSVSYGLSSVANNIRIGKGDNIIMAHEQFPSNVYTWKSLAQKSGADLLTVKPPLDTDNRGKQWNERILEAIDQNTKLVAISNVHWADGTLFDLKRIRERTREVDTLLVIDGTQSVGALPFDIADIEPDALVCAGYKWLTGPYSIGLAYYGPYFDDKEPIEENWINRKESEDFANLVNYQDEYKPKALRYSVGEQSNFVLVPMLLEAIIQLKEWGIENIQSYCTELMSTPIAELQDLGCKIEDGEYRGNHLIGARLPEHLQLEQLTNELVKRKIYVSIRGDAIRISTNIYNHAEDLNRLVDCIRDLS